MCSKATLVAMAIGLSLALGGEGFAPTSSTISTTQKPDGQKTRIASTKNFLAGQFSDSTTTQHSDGTKTTAKTEKSDNK